MASVIIADDHPLTLRGIAGFLQELKHTIIATNENGIACFNSIVKLDPQIAILDVNMPGLTGLEVLEKLHVLRIQTNIILLTMHKELSYYKTAMQFGCKGYLLKDYAQDELEDCIKIVLDGGTYKSKYLDGDLIMDKQISLEKYGFTKTEIKILELIAMQKNNKELSEMLFVSDKTIESHKRNISTKLDLPKERNALLKWALKNF